jgi:hypothetical protein
MAAEKQETQNIDDIISAAETKNKYKTTEVNKQIEPQTDLGNLLITDINLFERQNFK